MSHTFPCPNCTAPLTIEEQSALAVKCPYCGMSAPIPESLRTTTTGTAPKGMSDALVAQVAAAIAAGRRMEAIKLIHSATGVGLAAAEQIYTAMSTGDAATLDRFLSGAAISGPKIVVRRTSCLGTLVIWLLIFVIGAGVFLWQGGSAAVRLLRSVLPSAVGERVEQAAGVIAPPYAGLIFQQNAVLVNSDRKQPDVVGIAYRPSDNKHFLVYVDVISNTLAWRSEADPQSTFAVGSDAVVVATKSRLRAIDRASGATRWETSLSDEIANACDECLFVSGGVAFALTNDAIVQAFDVSDGRKLWSQTLSPVTPRITMWKDKVVVIDRDEGNEPGIDARVRVIDAAGDVGAEFRPSCETPRTKNSTGGRESADADSALFVDADADALFAWYGGFSSCVQKYSLVDGALAWEAQVDARAEDIRGTQLLKLADRLLLVGDESVLSIDPSTGKTVVAYRIDEDHDGLYAFGAVDDALVVATTKTRGTRKDELAAIDLASGAVRWTRQFDEDGGSFTQQRSYSGLLSDNAEESAWTVHVDASGVHLLRIMSKPFRYAFETLDVTTGVAGQRREAPVAGDPLLLGPALLDWRGSIAWVHVDDAIVALDIAAGSVAAKIGP